jgi:hypothetical protein
VKGAKLFNPANGQAYGTDAPVAGCTDSTGHIDSTEVTVLSDGRKHVEITRTDTNPTGGDLGGEPVQIGMQVDYKSTADVEVRKEFVGPDNHATAGYPYAWRIVVINHGPGPAKGVLLTDHFPNAFQVYPMAISTNGGEKDYTPRTSSHRATLLVEWNSIPPPDPNDPDRNRRVVHVGGEFNKSKDISIKTVDNVAEVEVDPGRTVDPKPGNNAAAREVRVYQ